MKITGVRAYPLSIPLRPMQPHSPWLDGMPKQIIVKITTDDGLTGLGECFAYGAPLAVVSVVDESLAPLLLGEDPTEIERWDLAGKALHAPVYDLLGGLYAPSIRAYASLLRYTTPADVAAACRVH